MSYSPTDINGKNVQTESLENVENLRLDCEEVDIIFEADPALSGQIQLVTTGGERQPELRRQGFDLIVYQRGRHRAGLVTRQAPVVRIPADGCPPINGRHQKGDLLLRGLHAPITLKHDVGDIAIESGHGQLMVDSAKGDFAVRQHQGPVSFRGGAGDVQLHRCSGPMTVSIGKGDVEARECERGVAVNSGSGDVQLADCSGELVVKQGSGDVVVTNPRDSRLSVSTGSGDVEIEGGSLLGLAVRAARGDITSSARLLLPRGDEDQPTGDESEYPDFEAEFESIEGLIERTVRDAISRAGAKESIVRAVEDAMSSSGTRINLGDLEFMAGDDGVRLTRGGTPIFEASDAGVRFSKGTFAFEANDAGVRFKRGSRAGEMGVRPGEYEVETSSGDVSMHVPVDIPVRIEALVNSGDVRSDIPLVSVGRPGPRGATQRLVGGTNPGGGPRLNLRVRSDRGDIRIRAVRYATGPSTRPAAPTPPVPPDAPLAPVPPQPPLTPEPPKPKTEREERMQTILDSLASGSLSVAEAERLLAALDKPQS